MAPLLSYHFTSFESNKQSKERKNFISLKCEVSVIKRFIFKLNVLIIIKSSKKAQRILSKGDSIPLPSPAPPLVSAHFTPTSGLRHRGELCRADTEETQHSAAGPLTVRAVLRSVIPR